MKQEEIKAVKELLKKIPEDELNKAVGGLSPAAKKAFAMAGILGAGAAVGFVGTWGIQHLISKNKKSSTNSESQTISTDSIELPTKYKLNEDAENDLIEYAQNRSAQKTTVPFEKDDELILIYDMFLGDIDIKPTDLSLQQFIGLYNAKHPDKPIK